MTAAPKFYARRRRAAVGSSAGGGGGADWRALPLLFLLALSGAPGAFAAAADVPTSAQDRARAGAWATGAPEGAPAPPPSLRWRPAAADAAAPAARWAGWHMPRPMSPLAATPPPPAGRRLAAAASDTYNDTRRARAAVLPLASRPARPLAVAGDACTRSNGRGDMERCSTALRRALLQRAAPCRPLTWRRPSSPPSRSRVPA